MLFLCTLHYRVNIRLFSIVKYSTMHSSFQFKKIWSQKLLNRSSLKTDENKFTSDGCLQHSRLRCTVHVHSRPAYWLELKFMFYSIWERDFEIHHNIKWRPACGTMHPSLAKQYAALSDNIMYKRTDGGSL